MSHADDFGYGNRARACLGALCLPSDACWFVRASVCAQLNAINDTAAAASTAAERDIADNKQASYRHNIIKKLKNYFNIHTHTHTHTRTHTVEAQTHAIW